MTGVDPAPARPRRRRRRAAAVACATGLATVAVAVGATLGLGGRGDEPPRRTRTAPAATAPVTRETLVEAVTLDGALDYGTAVPLACTAAGTVTWLPRPGVVVRRGGTLLRADERPVVLLYGALPMYRRLATGTAGTDVRQFEGNLSALGYGGFTVDDRYSAATAGAVKRWQKSLGLPETGAVDRERVVYAPGAVRIARQLVRLGASAAADVLSYTGTRRSITVSAPAADAAWAAPGAKVTVTLPDGAAVAGRVREVADAPPQSGETRDGDGDTVTVTIGVADQKALGRPGTAAVTVRYVARERTGVLTVPVSALLALAEGGYGLEVVDAAGNRVVPVEVGMFAGGRVEVSGADLAEGTVVGMPA